MMAAPAVQGRCDARFAAVREAFAANFEAGREVGASFAAITYGYLVGEVVRRITGRPLGVFFRDEVAAPLGADFHIGLPATEDARVAEMVPPTAEETAAAGRAGAVDPESLPGRVLSNPPLK